MSFENLRCGPLILLTDSITLEDAVDDALNQGVIPLFKEVIDRHPDIKMQFPDCTHVIHTIVYSKKAEYES